MSNFTSSIFRLMASPMRMPVLAIRPSIVSMVCERNDPAGPTLDAALSRSTICS